VSYEFRFLLAHPFCDKEHVFPQGKHAVDRKSGLALASNAAAFHASFLLAPIGLVSIGVFRCDRLRTIRPEASSITRRGSVDEV
jgi:hypothetical protein